MMLIENVTDQTNNNRTVSVTHVVTGNGKSAKHTIRIYKPRPSAGPLAGELIACYVLSAEQAMELKAHL